MMAFWTLFKKEIKSTAFIAGIFALLIILGDFLLLSRDGVWPRNMIMGLTMIPLFVLPFWALGTAFYNMHAEWSTKSIYLLLLLPLRGWKVIGAKLAAVLTWFTALNIFSAAITWVSFNSILLEQLRNIDKVPFEWILSVFFLFVLAHIFTVAFLVILAQFSFLSGYMFTRFRGAVTGATFLLSAWVVLRLGTLLTPLFGWLPDIPLRLWNNVNNVVQSNTLTLNTGPIAAAVLIAVGFFVLSGWLFERKVEV